MITVILSLLLLLAAPGPTNALLFAAGVSAQTPPFRLVFSALAGYGLAIAAGVGVIGPLAEANPQLVLPLRLFAALVLFHVAWRLWHSDARLGATSAAVTSRAVFATTLLNPKALVIALALWPSLVEAGVPVAGALIATAIAGTALGWIGAGAAFRRGLVAGRQDRAITRGCALLLGAFGAAVAAAAFSH